MDFVDWVDGDKLWWKRFIARQLRDFEDWDIGLRYNRCWIGGQLGRLEFSELSERDVRNSGRKLKTADIRRSVVVRRGREMACLTCVSTALRPVLPALSIACGGSISEAKPPNEEQTQTSIFTLAP